MAVSVIGVADADTPDKYLHTWQRTISGTAREDQFVLSGQGVYPTYSVSVYLPNATGDEHLVQVMGDGTNYSRLQRVTIMPGNATAAAVARIDLVRVSSAGTGGSATAVNAYDTSDTYAGAAKYGITSSKGTEGATLAQFVFEQSASSVAFATPPIVWNASPGAKPIIFGTATSDGIVMKNINASTGGYVSILLEFITTSFL